MKDLDDGGEANEGSDGEGGEVNSNEFKIERRRKWHQRMQRWVTISKYPIQFPPKSNLGGKIGHAIETAHCK